jgi:hypothetical protein
MLRWNAILMAELFSSIFPRNFETLSGGPTGNRTRIDRLKVGCTTVVL